jgi:hypothetical protein
MYLLAHHVSAAHSHTGLQGIAALDGLRERSATALPRVKAQVEATAAAVCRRFSALEYGTVIRTYVVLEASGALAPPIAPPLPPPPLPPRNLMSTGAVGKSAARVKGESTSNIDIAGLYIPITLQ